MEKSEEKKILQPQCYNNKGGQKSKNYELFMKICDLA